MPGSYMGSYCAPPTTSILGPATNNKQKTKKIKTYSAYSVSRDCAVHGPCLERRETRDSMRDSRDSLTRKLSMDRWRRSSSSSITNTSSDLGLDDADQARPVIDNLPPVNYQSTELVRGRQSRPSFRRYASFRSNLNEILYEVDEDEDEEDVIEEKNQETRIPFSFRYDTEKMDSMGILGLSSFIREKTKHDPTYLEAGIRKQSLNSHQM